AGPQTLEQLRTENEELRSLLLEMEQALQSTSHQDSTDWEVRVQEYESLLEEKNDLIRDLHHRLQELEGQQDAPTARGMTAAPREEELLALSEELERERRQLKEDEEAL